MTRFRSAGFFFEINVDTDQSYSKKACGYRVTLFSIQLLNQLWNWYPSIELSGHQIAENQGFSYLCEEEVGACWYGGGGGGSNWTVKIGKTCNAVLKSWIYILYLDLNL